MTNKNDIAVSVRGLSKSYSIAHNAVQHSTLGEALVHRLKNPLHRPERETFWALKDVDFDIHKGDVVGIIGRNGAGKSTLLKVLSRITEPTRGKAILNGRVGSLLEVGTGFHAELTGRENIFLNGAILGMSKREIAQQFDAIVDFSGVEQFLDTPVKRYSSGMYVRLAFAVAAHLNPEILIVDEVLAVGDAEFQKKCMGKMRDVAAHGRTVLFVSHQIAAVQRLCNHVLVMKEGHLAFQGDLEDGISVYVNQARSVSVHQTIDLRNRVDRIGPGPVRFTQCRFLHGDAGICSSLNEYQLNEKIGISLTLQSQVAVEKISVGYAILDMNGTVLFTSHHNDTLAVHELSSGETIFESWISPNYLQPGQYTIQVGVLVKDLNSDFIPDVAQFGIASILGERRSKLDARPGVMRMDFPWHMRGQSYKNDVVTPSQNKDLVKPSAN